MLTGQESKTYQFIQQFIRKNNYSPTMAEIAEGLGIKSRGVVHRYVHRLASSGLIRVLPNRRRNIQLLVRTKSKWVLPLLGKIAAGLPIETVPENETIDVADILLGADRFGLKVKGDSMIDEGILDGDIIICKKAQTAEDGQIALVLIDGQWATLKRLRHNKGNTITLMPVNVSLEPLVIDAARVEVQGVFVGLLRA